MANGQKIKVALIRGNSLNIWEGGLWQNLSSEIVVEGFCSNKNLYETSALTFPIQHLPASTDNKAYNYYSQYILGRYQKLYGLENKLANFDIAHTAEISYYYTRQAVEAKKYNNKLKVVATVWDNSFGRFDSHFPLFGGSPQFWKKMVFETIQKNIAGVDLFLPVTLYSAELLLMYGVPKKKIQILTPAVPISDEKTNLPTDLNSNDEIYLMVNRLVEEKGVYDVLYGWKIYLQTVNGFSKKLWIIGAGPERRKMEELTRSLGIEKNVNFLGTMPNDKVRSLYKFAKVLILGSLATPLWQEQFGYVLAEAICSGCPVLTTFSGAIREVVGEAGLLYSPGNPAELKNQLTKLDDPNVYLNLKKACETEKRKFDYEKFKQELVEAYYSLV